MDEKYNMNDTAPGPQPGAGESATRAQTCAPPDPMPPLREEPPKKVRRAGTFTLGLVLVAAGVLLVLSSVLPSFDMRWALRLAPVVFIGLGIEVLIYAARPDVKLKYDGVSIFLCIVLVCGAGCGAIVGRALDYYDPAVSQAEEQLRADCEAKTTELLTAQPDLQQKIADISANIELHYRSGGAQDIEPQAGDYLNLYVTIWPEACATREDFAALARQIMDACAAAGLPYTTYRFDTLQQGITDGMVTYELYVGGDWRRAADAGALARSVQETYWYNGDGFTNYGDMHNYQQEMLRQNLVDEYYEKFGESPSAEWLDEQLAKTATSESAAL